MSHAGTGIVQRIATVLIITGLTLLAAGMSHSEAHQDPCHRLHSCPSDHHTYICGDKGRCGQCPDNQFCQSGSRVWHPRRTLLQRHWPRPSLSHQPPAGRPYVSPRRELYRPDCSGPGRRQGTILVQAYSLTSAPIAKALLDAHKRGVQVQVILDKSQRTEKYSSADFLANQGVPTMIDASHAIAHNKVMIIDSETVITGSFNFTKAAQEKNAENVLIIPDKPWRHSTPRTGRRIGRISQPMSGVGWAR